MAIRVPTFERKEQGRLLDRTGIQAKVSADALGAGIGRGLAAVGEAVGTIRNTLVNRSNQAVLNKFKNDLYEASDEALIGEEGYLNKSGKDAMDGLQPALDDYKEMSGKIVDGITNNKSIANQMEAIRAQNGLSLSRRAQAHAVGETAKYEEKQHLILRQNLKGQIITGRHDLFTIHQKTQEIQQANEQWGKLKGQSKEEIEQATKLDLNAAYTQVIQAYVNEEDYKTAQSFMDIFDGDISPEQKTRIQATLTRGVTNQETSEIARDASQQATIDNDFTVETQEEVVADLTKDIPTDSPEGLAKREQIESKVRAAYTQERARNKAIDNGKWKNFTIGIDGKTAETILKQANALPTEAMREAGRNLANKGIRALEAVPALTPEEVSVTEYDMRQAVVAGVDGFQEADDVRAAALLAGLPQKAVDRLVAVFDKTEDGISIVDKESMVKASLAFLQPSKEHSNEEITQWVNRMNKRIGSQEFNEDSVRKSMSGLMMTTGSVAEEISTGLGEQFVAATTLGAVGDFGTTQVTGTQAFDAGQLGTFLPDIPDDKVAEVDQFINDSKETLVARGFDPDTKLDPRIVYREFFLGLPRLNENSNLQDKRFTGELGQTGITDRLKANAEKRAREFTRRTALNNVIDGIDSVTHKDLNGIDAMESQLVDGASSGTDPQWLTQYQIDNGTQQQYLAKKAAHARRGTAGNFVIQEGTDVLNRINQSR